MLESISKRIIDARLSAKGSGETDPITPNKSVAGRDKPEGRVKNRRTGFEVTGELKKELIMKCGFTRSTIEEDNK